MLWQRAWKHKRGKSKRWFNLMDVPFAPSSASSRQYDLSRLLNAVPHVKTLTLDNGKEFAKHAKIKNEANVEIYFAHPYSSWERGTNENTNGLIRQYLPKSRRLDNVTEHELEFIMFRLNHRPRKRIGYLTPHEVFFENQPVALDT